jgi:hypothetical protein
MIYIPFQELVLTQPIWTWQAAAAELPTKIRGCEMGYVSWPRVYNEHLADIFLNTGTAE